MTVAFVLGNGLSRQDIDCNQLNAVGTTYGCNALYREFTPTVLVSTDAPISKTIQESGYSQQHQHYTRKPLPELGSKRIPQQYYGFSSGPVATGLAALNGHSKIYLIGFDMGPTLTGHFNNVYAGTEFYKKEAAAPTYTGNWIRQIASIVNEFGKTQFVRVQGPTTATIPDLVNIRNLKHMPLQEFVDRINNGKDL